MAREDRQLAIDLYLDQRVVFDLLAIVEGEFAQLRTVKTSESDTQTNKSDAGGEVGITNAFAFLGINLRGSRTREQAAATHTESSEERVYTPTSLFSRLRDVLIERSRLQVLDNHPNLTGIQPGMFVEFEAVLQKNPLIHTIEEFLQLLEMQTLFTGKPLQVGQQKGGGASRKTVSAEAQVVDELKRFLKMVSQDRQTDLVASVVGSDLRCVIPIERQYFSGKSPDDLLDGQYTVLGKVERVIQRTEGSEAISLLRGTTLGLIADTSIDETIALFKTIPAQLNFPNVEVRVPGPAMLVRPIAIFL